MSSPRFSMLPGGVLAESGASKRTTRDWIVDVIMLAAALLVGLIALGGTEDYRSETGVSIDFLVGLACFIPLWWRRRHPWGVFLILLVPSSVFAMAAGPALVSLF